MGANTWDSAVQVMPPEVEAPAGAAPAAAAIIVPAAPRAAALLAEIVVPAALQAAELQAEIEAAPQPGARSSPVMLLSLPLPRRRARVCERRARCSARARGGFPGCAAARFSMRSRSCRHPTSAEYLTCFNRMDALRALEGCKP